MRKWMCFSLLFGLFLAACASGKPVYPVSQPGVPGGIGVPEPTDTALPKFPTEKAPPTLPPAPTNTPVAVSKPIADSSGSMPGCTAKSLFPTPDPTAAALFPPVSEADWVRGPKTAAVTLIEYSDFQ